MIAGDRMEDARHFADGCPFHRFARTSRPDGDTHPVSRRTANPNHSQGFTIIELVIVIAVTGVLLALLLPAIQSSRESARRQGCRSNLKQLGIATHAYESTHDVLPNEGNSVLVSLLAELDQAQMAADFSADYWGAEIRYKSTRLPVLVCPSQTGSDGAWVNYGMNWGRQANGEPLGGFRVGRHLGFSDVPDGASNTAWLAEFQAGFYPEGFVIDISPYQYAEDDFARSCEHSTLSGGSTGRGTPWPDGWGSAYDHLLPPNRRNCRNVLPGGVVFHRTVNAGSHHSGGANILLLDGSVRFISDHVDRVAWRSLGTRNGNESIHH
jgi:prepilin-type N-terminal cleavage/methylation domain-containing protein/prepilin-type processing-associated H-X9-DG protein